MATANKIALWTVEAGCEGGSLYWRQVFHPLGGKDQGWARLAKTSKVGFHAYGGTASPQFEPGECTRGAVKIAEDRGMESRKVMEVK